MNNHIHFQSLLSTLLYVTAYNGAYAGEHISCITDTAIVAEYQIVQQSDTLVAEPIRQPGVFKPTQLILSGSLIAIGSFGKWFKWNKNSFVALTTYNFQNRTANIGFVAQFLNMYLIRTPFHIFYFSNAIDGTTMAQNI